MPSEFNRRTRPSEPDTFTQCTLVAGDFLQYLRFSIIVCCDCSVYPTGSQPALTPRDAHRIIRPASVCPSPPHPASAPALPETPFRLQESPRPPPYSAVNRQSSPWPQRMSHPRRFSPAPASPEGRDSSFLNSILATPIHFP